MSATVTDCVAFADGPGGGNPCPVVRGADRWTDAQMQAAAAAFGHETCFVLAPSDPDAAARLRYFVPRHEMEMCVHATVAAAVLLDLPDGAAVQTPLGLRRLERPEPGVAVVEQSPPQLGSVVEDVGPWLRALGAGAGALGEGPVQTVSTARPKLLLPLVDEAALDALRPDVEALRALCDAAGATGVYAFTEQAADVDAAARQFPVRAGYDEDPATGVAACALGAWLALRRAHETEPGPAVRRWTIAQGRAMGRPSLIEAETRLRDGVVAGTAVGGVAAVLGAPEPLAAPHPAGTS